MRVDLARFDETPVWQQFGGLRDVQERFRLAKPSSRKAVADVYDLSYELFGPYYHALMQGMLPVLHHDVTTNEAAVVACCGRDSAAQSASLAGSDAQFHRDFVRDVSVSRVSSSLGYRDGRQQNIIIPPSNAAEREWQERVFSQHGYAQDATGAFGHMERYMQRIGLPVSSRHKGGTVIVHDFACASGTTQEFMRAAFPRTQIIGRYATTWLKPEDPHRNEKHGYLWHGDEITYLDGVPGAANTMVSYGCWVTESLLSGPWGTVVDIRADGPVQHLDDTNRANRSVLVKFDPRLYGEYRPWEVWAAGKTAALIAVYKYAQDHAGRDPEWAFSTLQQGQDPLSRAVRGWTFPASGVPVEDLPRTIFDAYVPRRALRPNETTKPVFAGAPLKESTHTVRPVEAVEKLARTFTPVARMPWAEKPPSNSHMRRLSQVMVRAYDRDTRTPERGPAMAATLNKAK